MNADRLVPLSDVFEEIIKIQISVKDEEKAIDRKLTAAQIIGALLSRFCLPPKTDKDHHLKEG